MPGLFARVLTRKFFFSPLSSYSLQYSEIRIAIDFTRRHFCQFFEMHTDWFDACLIKSPIQFFFLFSGNSYISHKWKTFWGIELHYCYFHQFLRRLKITQRKRFILGSRQKLPYDHLLRKEQTQKSFVFLHVASSSQDPLVQVRTTANRCTWSAGFPQSVVAGTLLGKLWKSSRAARYRRWSVFQDTPASCIF